MCLTRTSHSFRLSFFMFLDPFARFLLARVSSVPHFFLPMHYPCAFSLSHSFQCLTLHSLVSLVLSAMSHLSLPYL